MILQIDAICKNSRTLEKQYASALAKVHPSFHKGSKARIMVTLPAEAADDKGLVRDLVAAGMSWARINCAHDDVKIWKAMIGNVEQAKRKTGRNCKICMDLGGPKLRTGAMTLGPQVIHLQPKRDLFGHVVSPARVWLASPDIQPPSAADAFLPISIDGINHAEKGDKIRFTDARGKRCALVIDEPQENGRWANCFESAYVATGTELRRDNENTIVARIGELPAVEQSITLTIGDTLVLHADTTLGGPAQYDAEGNLLQPAHISCTLPEVFQQEEILWLCEAAHLPIIWATQVLETLAKKGIPSRAEISDAAMAQQAECVMLNKGPHILETVRMLDDILKSMEDYLQKKAPMLPALKASGELSFK